MKISMFWKCCAVFTALLGSVIGCDASELQKSPVEENKKDSAEWKTEEFKNTVQKTVNIFMVCDNSLQNFELIEWAFRGSNIMKSFIKSILSERDSAIAKGEKWDFDASYQNCYQKIDSLKTAILRDVFNNDDDPSNDIAVNLALNIFLGNRQ